jgi:pimeloyl-ACP methyl ester carboxylesterase
VYAKVNGAELYYDTRGQGDALLLLHAGIADSRMWDDQFQVFAQRYRVIRYDLRGFGQSLMPSGAYAHHDDAAGLLDHLNVDKADVLGVSFGGSVALDFALAYPERVKALVLSAPYVSGYRPTSEELVRFDSEEEAALGRGDLDAATELNVRTWVDGPHRTPQQVDPTVRERVREMQYRTFANPEAEEVRSLPLDPPAIARLGEIRAPTLVVVGDQDVREFVALADLVAREIWGAEKAVIPETAHVPNMELPELFNQIVLAFLAER